MRTALRSSQSDYGRSTGRGTVSSFSTFRYVIIILFFVSFRYFRYFWSITMPSAFVKPLILWYNSECRLLPWRETKDPYRIWVSEIMLQQTRVEAVCGYYERFLAALPDIESLAACPEDQLLKLWEGLGYYSRARNLQKAARLIMEKYGGKLPEDAGELRKLPGIGEYTAGAIASIAFGKAEPAVDGNVIRVTSRLRACTGDVRTSGFKKELVTWLRQAHDGADGTWGILNQAFMDLGSMICTANKSPLCAECPVSSFCEAKKAGIQDSIPARAEKKGRRIEERTVVLYTDGERFAIRRRPDKGLLSGLYEFPNYEGKLAREEILLAAREDGMYAVRIRELPEAKHIFTHVEWHMTGYEIMISRNDSKEGSFIFAEKDIINEQYPIPSAFAAYADAAGIKVGKK